jgi:hypothetical protein
VYNVATLLAGVVVLAALAVAFWARPRVILPLFGLAVALAVFGLSVLASGVYVWARLISMAPSCGQHPPNAFAGRAPRADLRQLRMRL